MGDSTIEITLKDEVSFGAVLGENRQYLYEFALSLTKNQEDAMDLLQDTMLQAFVKRDRYKEDNNFRGWLMTIMKNFFINKYRRAIKYPTHGQVEKFEHLIMTGAKESNKALDNLAFDEIYSCVESLEEKYRKSFLMYYKGFKYLEIAERFGIPLGTVKNRIHTARKILSCKVRKRVA